MLKTNLTLTLQQYNHGKTDNIAHKYLTKGTHVKFKWFLRSILEERVRKMHSIEWISAPHKQSRHTRH